MSDNEKDLNDQLSVDSSVNIDATLWSVSDDENATETTKKEKVQYEFDEDNNEKKPKKKLSKKHIIFLLTAAAVLALIVIGALLIGKVMESNNRASDPTGFVQMPWESVSVPSTTGENKQTTVPSSTTKEQKSETTTKTEKTTTKQQTTTAKTPATTKPTTEHQHVWSEWSPEDDRTHARTCKVCGLTETEHCSLPDTPDDYWEPSCEDIGLCRFVCSICHACWDEITPALGHDWSGWEYDDWDHYRYCDRCGEFDGYYSHYDNNSDGYCDICRALFDSGDSYDYDD